MYSGKKFLQPSEFLKWVSKYSFEGAALQDLIGTSKRYVDSRVLDLTVARLDSNPLVLNVPGRGFVFYAYEYLSATRGVAVDSLINVRIGSNRPECSFPAKHQRGFRGDFVSLYLSWPAQSGVYADFVIFQFDAKPWMCGNEAT